MILRLLVLALILCIPHSAWSAIAFVKVDDDGSCAGCTSTVKAYTGGNTAGNLLTACFVMDPAQTVASMTDTRSNTWTRAHRIIGGGGGTVEIWYAMNVSAGANTVTGNYSGSTSYAAMMLHEYSGAAISSALDVVAAQNQTNPGVAADAVSSGANTTTVNGALIFGCTGEGGGAGILSAGTSFTLRSTVYGDSPSEDRIQATAGSVAATFTTDVSTSNHTTVMGTFKPFVAVTRHTGLLMRRSGD